MKIKPFAGVRPPKELAAEVASRPYDVLNSVEAKAEYKHKAMTYLIGSILIFSVKTKPNILYKIGTGLTSNI